jgi:hypothetical protein
VWLRSLALWSSVDDDARVEAAGAAAAAHTQAADEQVSAETLGQTGQQEMLIPARAPPALRTAWRCTYARSASTPCFKFDQARMCTRHVDCRGYCGPVACLRDPKHQETVPCHHVYSSRIPKFPNSQIPEFQNSESPETRERPALTGHEHVGASLLHHRWPNPPPLGTATMARCPPPETRGRLGGADDHISGLGIGKQPSRAVTLVMFSWWLI